MIYTLTFNPSLDYNVQVADMRLGRINRAATEQILPGGKGINVSTVLRNLGHESEALGFVAGFTGAEVEHALDGLGVGHRFIHVAEGFTRINVKIKSTEETELNGQGPRITPADIDALYQQLDALATGDTLVISGSVPSTLPADMYERIMARLSERQAGVRVVVDAERDLLTRVLPYGPFLIKPNNIELGDIFGVELRRREEVIPYARELQSRGAVNVLVSMAGEGGVLVDERGQAHEASAARGRVVNSVGAGDSAVAGFLAGYDETGSYETAFRYALACGSASAFSPNLATRAEVEAMLAQP